MENTDEQKDISSYFAESNSCDLAHVMTCFLLHTTITRSVSSISSSYLSPYEQDSLINLTYFRKRLKLSAPCILLTFYHLLINIMHVSMSYALKFRDIDVNLLTTYVILKCILLVNK